jgi:hypothetical protein
MINQEIKVIDDITHLLIDDPNPDNLLILLYQIDELEDNLDEKIENISNIEVLDELDNMDLPEYRNIICSAFKYIIENKIIKKKQKYMNLNILVKEESAFAKNHKSPENDGYVRLLTLALLFKKKDIEIFKMAINGKLLHEKIDISCEPPPEYEIEDNETSILINDIDCPVCMSNKGEMIKTSCDHTMHLNCLKLSPRMECPLCRTNQIDFLKHNGVPLNEIEKILKYAKMEVELKEWRDILPTHLKNIDKSDLLRICGETLKLNGGNIISYFDLIFDMNANASQFLSKISSYYYKKNKKGFFAYMYDSPTEVIMQMSDPSSHSIVEWISILDFEKWGIQQNIVDAIYDRLNRIDDTNYNDKYVVSIFIENHINFHVLDKNSCDLPTSHRMTQDEILNSLAQCTRCRNFDNIPNTNSNREYKWAKNKMNNLNKQHTKKIKFSQKN